MFKMLFICTHGFCQSLSRLDDHIDSILLQTVPTSINQALLQLSNTVQMTFIRLLVSNILGLIVH